MPSRVAPSGRGPLRFFLATDCGIEIKLINDHQFEHADPTDSPLGNEYVIVNTDADLFHGLEFPSDDFRQGTMSPISRVNLPPFARHNSGIPLEASYFALIMAPNNLKECFGDYEDVIKELRSVQCLKLPRELSKSKSKSRIRRRGSAHVGKTLQRMISPAMYISNRDDEGESFFLKHDAKEEESNGMNVEMDANREVLHYRRLALASFAIFHGYAYFDENMNFIQINSNVLSKTDYTLQYAGPYKTPKETIRGLADMGRIHPTTVEIFYEAGCNGFSWVGTGELFGGKPAAEGHSCAYGGIVFCLDDDTAITYVVPTEHDSQMPLVQSRSLVDTFEAIYMQTSYTFSDRLIHHQDDIDDCNDRLRVMMKELRLGKLNTWNSSVEIEPFPLLHTALKAKASIADITFILDSKFVEFDLQDAHGLYPLHYACRFSAGDDKLFELLLSRCPPEAILQSDRFNRYPLHIACDSNPSPSVIKMLIERVEGAGDIIYEKTRFTGMVPLHIACDSGSDIGVIQVLLNADKRSESIRDMTACGRIPLHIAIEKRLPYGVIRLLIVAEQDLNLDHSAKLSKRSRKSIVKSISHLGKFSIGRMLDNSNPLTASMRYQALSSQNDGIYKWFKGLLPLHMALLQNYDAATIRILVNSDFEQTSHVERLLYRPLLEEDAIGETSVDQSEPQSRRSLKSDYSCIDASDGLRAIEMNVQRGLTDANPSLHGVRALHVALLTRATETVRFMLQEERQDIISRHERQERAEMCSKGGMTCLHLACRNNERSDIIKLLLDLDPSKVTSVMKDERGFTPLHYACAQEKARRDVIELLLLAEERYSKGENVGLFKLSTSSLCRRGKSPLAYATRAEASAEVLELLLQSRYFNLIGFDEAIEKELAGRISEDARLQRAVVATLSKRETFTLLFLQLLFYVMAIIVYFIQSDKLVRDIATGAIDARSDTFGFYILIFVFVIFVLREILQLFSERSNYFLDVQNYFEILNVVTLLAATITMSHNHDSNDEQEIQLEFFVMLAGAFFLVATFIFFMRATFLPFSRFAEGLIVIFISLVPFLVVSCALLLLFTYAFRVGTLLNLSPSSESPSSSPDPTSAKSLFFPSVSHHGRMLPKTKISNLSGDGVRAEKCEESFGKCFMYTLQGFFSGTDQTEETLDILFGVVIVIVLLNVVIAIVSDAWESSKDKATISYWRGRLSFLSETRLVTACARRRTFARTLFNIVDGSRSVFIRGANIHWEKDYPYSLVKSKEQYENPHFYFGPEIADKILKVHSLKADLRWRKELREKAQLNGYEEDSNRFVQWWRLHPTGVLLKWLGYSMVHLFWIASGFLTFGILWPSHFRVWILSFGNSTEESGEDRVHLQLEKLEEKIQTLEAIPNEFGEEVKESLKVLGSTTGARIDKLESSFDTKITKLLQVLEGIKSTSRSESDER